MSSVVPAAECLGAVSPAPGVAPASPCRVDRALFRRFDAAHGAPGYPEGAPTEADARIFRHIDLEFTADRIRARIDLDDGHGMRADPDEPSADCHGTLTNGTRLDGGDEIATLAVN